MKLFLLSKQNIPLAIQEVLSLSQSKDFELIDNLLILKPKIEVDFQNRLGFTHSIFEFLFKCKNDDLENLIDSFNFQKYYQENFCVRVKGGSDAIEKEIASKIFSKLQNPKVKLRNSKTEFHFFVKGNLVICVKKLFDVDKSYINRKAHLRPSLHPTSMHPRLARVCINLTGLTNGLLLDPFCGSGGTLIEAGLMRFKIIGHDIDSNQINRAKKNLEHYSIKNFKLSVNDATKINMKVNAIVTDFPYGRGSKGDNLEELYLKFLVNAKNVTSKVVVVFPNFIDHKKIISKTKWAIEHEFRDYVHKSLSRIITVLA